MTDDQAKWKALVDAVAAYYDTGPDAILGLVLAVERIDPDTQGLVLSSAWSGDTPPWRLESFTRELLHQLDRQRADR